jgi:hypothetical protein
VRESTETLKANEKERERRTRGGGVRGTAFIIITEKVYCCELARGERERV